jgi:hypothetical protein
MSHTRNAAVELLGAPRVVVREPPSPVTTLSVTYADDIPVLWDRRASEVTLRISNPAESPLTGTVRIETPPGILCSFDAGEISVPGRGEYQMLLKIVRGPGSAWIADKNLFTAIWSEGGDESTRRVFGLGGARQWQIYGPYWDMWDKKRNEVCPYNNEQFRGGPFMKGLTGDCYNQYAELDAAYIDEARLLLESIPEEVPLLLEHGEDHLNCRHFGGFRGQATYYLVRTIRSRIPGIRTRIFVGRTGPVRLWLDGVEIATATDIRCWCFLDDINPEVTLTGEAQRLVIKLIRWTDAFDFSLYFAGRDDIDYKRGVSNILDCIEDAAPPATR